MPARNGMIHLNNNLLTAIDVETTGLDPTIHEIIQICALPLDHELNPHKHFRPFYTYLAPQNPEGADPRATDVNRVKLAEIVLSGLDPGQAADLFLGWFEKLQLGWNKRLVPLAHNWPFDRDFLKTWLGAKTFEYIFDPRYRDTMTAASFMNDRADWHSEAFPYPKVNLSYLAKCLGVDHEGAHDAMTDCSVTRECYKRLLLA